jgi:hypothetical protein
VSEIVAGRTTKTFARAPKKVKPELCFSIVASKRTLDLEVESEQDRDFCLRLFNALLDLYWHKHRNSSWKNKGGKGSSTGFNASSPDAHVIEIRYYLIYKICVCVFVCVNGHHHHRACTLMHCVCVCARAVT